MPTPRTLFGLLFAFLSSPALAGEPPTIPLGGGADGIEGSRLVPLPRVEAKLSTADRADGDRPALAVAFRRAGDGRRLLALEAPFRGGMADPKALSIRCRLALSQGQPPRLALVAYEKGGAAWYHVATLPLLAGNEFAEARLPLASLRRAEFSTGSEKEKAPKWENVEKVWIGLVTDGPAEGTFELSRAALTSEPYRPTQALPLRTEAGDWHVGKDAAAQAKINSAPEGPNGKPCLKTEFAFPGRRHVYVTPAAPIGELELAGYQGLRFTYKAKLPPGIDGLLVCLNERGGAQYYADPAPPASDEWKTVTIPFTAFKLGNWSKDENGRLDLDQIASVVIGLHGAASVDSASGAIWATDIEFVP